jgi:4-hydroxyphenylacetate 3-monooxygenase
VDELARLGVPEPTGIPAFYPVPPQLLSVKREIQVSSPATSGEVEPVLFCANGSWYVGVGSDHTARDLERVDIGLSKAACPKVIGTEVIDYDEAVEHWDQIQLRSRTGSGGDLYQDGLADELLPVPELLDLMRSREHEVGAGSVIFLGTLGLKAADFVYSDRWSMELAVPGGPTLTCSYEVAVASEPSEVTT